jgi:hypothetical protein
MQEFDKPSSKEEEYFARQEAERKRKVAEERRGKLEQEERERLKTLHYMKCPKCGMDLQEIAFGEVKVDKCFSCEGLWLDHGELERINKKEGLLGRLSKVFHS